MTFGQTSLGRTMSRTRLLLQRQLWIWPIIAVVFLAAIGYAMNLSIQRTMEDTLRSQIQTLLTVERSMLEKWFKVQEASALALANNHEVRQTVAQLLAESSTPARKKDGSNGEEVTADLRAQLAKELEPGLSSQDFVGYVLANKQQRVIAASSPELIGQTVPQYE